MYKKIIIGLGISLLLPAVAHAELRNFSDLVTYLILIINSLIPLLFGIAVLAFFWGVIHYIWSADPNKLNDARNYMIYSIIGIAVMLSVWGIALLLKNSFFPSATLPTSGGVDYYNGSDPAGDPTPPPDIFNPIENA
ncbi:MAG: pilin [bacterium]|nr:pilin [bacterium]